MSQDIVVNEVRPPEVILKTATDLLEDHYPLDAILIIVSGGKDGGDAMGSHIEGNNQKLRDMFATLLIETPQLIQLFESAISLAKQKLINDALGNIR